MKILKNKKAFNDVVLMIPIIMFLFLAGLIIPFINASFSQAGTTVNTEKAKNDLLSQVSNSNSLTIFTILSALLTTTFWTFGVPFIVNIFLEVFRIIFYILLYRQVRSGGG